MFEEPFIIAELSANHNQDLNIALESIKAIAKTRAHAVKLQTYKPSCLTLPYRNDFFKINNGLWKDSYLWDLYENAQMPWEWHSELFSLARSLNLTPFSSPFSVEGVAFLEKLDCPIYKIASFEVMHPLLLEAIAETKKPVILSLGVANDDEIEMALKVLRDNAEITLLYCISSYPALIQDAKLSNIAKIKKRWESYNIKVGLSDHTLGISVPIVATLCGISAIEKHFILDKTIKSVDSAFSLDIQEFSAMVRGVKDAYILAQDLLHNTLESRLALCNIKEQHAEQEQSNKKGREFARSLFISRDVKAGEILSLENIACVRPSLGVSPLKLHALLGKTFKADYKGGIPLSENYLY